MSGTCDSDIPQSSITHWQPSSQGLGHKQNVNSCGFSKVLHSLRRTCCCWQNLALALRDLPLQAPGACQLISELGRVKFEAITFGLESRASVLQAGDPLIYQDKEGQPLASLQGGVTRSLECISHIILPTPEKCTYKFEELSLNPKKHTQPGRCSKSLTLRLTAGWEVNIGETKA